MAEHDYVIANQNGANTRSDLNNALAAIVSNNSKATAPTTTYAFMWWADTANDILKQRNAADSAWISILTLSTGAPLGTLGLDSSGGVARATSGLLFNADTAAANTLDDYEEGTWTPEWTGSGGAPSGVNYSKRVGTYVKVGNSVTIIGAIAVSSWSSAPTGNLQISGLPFTNGSEDGGINIGNAKYIDCNGTALMGQLNANATTIDLYGYNDNASYANSTAANTGSSNFIWFSATYII